MVAGPLITSPFSSIEVWRSSRKKDELVEEVSQLCVCPGEGDV